MTRVEPIVVVDTQVFLRAAINERSLPAKVLLHHAVSFTLASSPETRAEAREVLYRPVPVLRRKFRTLTDERVERLLALLTDGITVQLSEIPPISRDPKDDKFLATAYAANAHYLVSEDNDLLSLKHYGNTRIVNMLEFWHHIKPASTSLGGNEDV